MPDQPAREKIVIRESPHVRFFITRARLAVLDKTDGTWKTTGLGTTLAANLAAADGIDDEIRFAHSGFGVQLALVHPALWAWDEVEPLVVAAFEAALGVGLDIVRDPATRTNT